MRSLGLTAAGARCRGSVPQGPWVPEVAAGSSLWPGRASAVRRRSPKGRLTRRMGRGHKRQVHTRVLEEGPTS